MEVQSMNEKEKELFDIFKEMSTETQNIYLSHGRFAISAEQAIKRQYGITSPAEAATWGDRLAEPGFARQPQGAA
jgi:hypothetical protein